MASQHNPAKVAIIIAGYTGADTTRGVNTVINGQMNLAVGYSGIV